LILGEVYLNVARLGQKFLASYGTQKFNTISTRARHWSLSWARWIQSTNKSI